MFPMAYVCFSYNHVRCMDSELYQQPSRDDTIQYRIIAFFLFNHRWRCWFFIIINFTKNFSAKLEEFTKTFLEVFQSYCYIYIVFTCFYTCQIHSFFTQVCNIELILFCLYNNYNNQTRADCLWCPDIHQMVRTNDNCRCSVGNARSWL